MGIQHPFTQSAHHPVSTRFPCGTTRSAGSPRMPHRAIGADLALLNRVATSPYTRRSPAGVRPATSLVGRGGLAGSGVMTSVSTLCG